MHQALLLHVKIQWLSGGKTLVPLLDLGTEQSIFITGHNFNRKNDWQKNYDQ